MTTMTIIIITIRQIAWLMISYFILLMLTHCHSFVRETRMKKELALPTDKVDYNYTRDKACTCRVMCFAKHGCTAVTIIQDDSGGFQCHLSESPPPLHGFLEVHEKAITIIDKEPKCIDPFEETDLFGCIYLYRSVRTFNNSRENCRTYNADLAVIPENKLEEFRAWFQGKLHFKNHYDPFWIGIYDGMWINGDPHPGTKSENFGWKVCGSIKANGGIKEEACETNSFKSICQYY